MPTTFWVGNAQNTAQTATITVTGVTGAGQSLTATISDKTVTYNTVSGDTNNTAASAWQALLNANTAPPEFQEETWSVATNVITTVANTPGLPFTLTVSSTGGATATLATTIANSSQSDVFSANNWQRLGLYALPVNGDDIVIQNSSVPLLYNLDKLANVLFNTLTIWQSFTATIGLPENNPGGYYEYRPTYWQFGSNVAALPINLNVGITGTGGTRFRFNTGPNQVALNLLGSGSPADDYAVRFLGTNSYNTFKVVNTSLGICMLPTETSTIASGVVDGGGSVSLGAGCSFSGQLTVNGASAFLQCNAGAVWAQQGSQIIVEGVGLTYASLVGRNGSSYTWNSNSNVTNLLLQTGSLFDKSGDVQPMMINSATIDADCVINDPHTVITYSNPGTIIVQGQIQSGPFLRGPTSLGFQTFKLS